MFAKQGGVLVFLLRFPFGCTVVSLGQSPERLSALLFTIYGLTESLLLILHTRRSHTAPPTVKNQCPEEFSFLPMVLAVQKLLAG